MKKPKCWLAVDPGNTGAIAMIPNDNKVISYGISRIQSADVVDFTTWDDMEEVIEWWSKDHYIQMCGLEKVWSRPGQNSKANDSLMINYGCWQGVLLSLHVPFELIAPATWQKIIKDEEGKDSKKKSLAAARREFPDLDLWLEKHHNRADALNICRYMRMNYDT